MGLATCLRLLRREGVILRCVISRISDELLEEISINHVLFARAFPSFFSTTERSDPEPTLLSCVPQKDTKAITRNLGRKILLVRRFFGQTTGPVPVEQAPPRRRASRQAERDRQDIARLLIFRGLENFPTNKIFLPRLRFSFDQ